MANDVIKKYSIEIDAVTNKANAQIETLEKELDNLSKSKGLSAGLQSQIDKFSKSLNGLKGEIKSSVKDINNNLTSINTSLDKIDTESMSKEFKDMQSSINSSIDSVKTEIQELQKFLKDPSVGKSFTSGIGKQFDELKETVLSTVKSLGLVSQVLDKVLSGQQSFDSLSALEKNIENASKGVKNELEDLEQYIHNLKLLDVDLLDPESIKEQGKETVKEVKGFIKTIQKEYQRLGKSAKAESTIVELLGMSSTDLNVLLSELKDKATNEVNKSRSRTIKLSYEIDSNNEDAIGKVVKSVENIIDKVQKQIDKKSIKIPVGYTTEFSELDKQDKIALEKAAKKDTDKYIFDQINLKVEADTSELKTKINKVISDINEDLKRPENKIEVEVVGKVNKNTIKDSAIDIANEVEKAQKNVVDGATINGATISGGSFSLDPSSGIATEDTLSEIRNILKGFGKNGRLVLEQEKKEQEISNLVSKDKFDPDKFLSVKYGGRQINQSTRDELNTIQLLLKTLYSAADTRKDFNELYKASNMKDDDAALKAFKGSKYFNQKVAARDSSGNIIKDKYVAKYLEYDENYGYSKEIVMDAEEFQKRALQDFRDMRKNITDLKSNFSKKVQDILSQKGDSEGSAQWQKDLIELKTQVYSKITDDIFKANKNLISNKDFDIYQTNDEDLSELELQRKEYVKSRLKATKDSMHGASDDDVLKAFKEEQTAYVNTLIRNTQRSNGKILSEVIADIKSEDYAITKEDTSILNNFYKKELDKQVEAIRKPFSEMVKKSERKIKGTKDLLQPFGIEFEVDGVKKSTSWVEGKKSTSKANKEVGQIIYRKGTALSDDKKEVSNTVWNRMNSIQNEYKYFVEDANEQTKELESQKSILQDMISLREKINSEGEDASDVDKQRLASLEQSYKINYNIADEIKTQDELYKHVGVSIEKIDSDLGDIEKSVKAKERSTIGNKALLREDIFDKKGTTYKGFDPKKAQKEIKERQSQNRIIEQLIGTYQEDTFVEGNSKRQNKTKLKGETDYSSLTYLEQEIIKNNKKRIKVLQEQLTYYNMEKGIGENLLNVGQENASNAKKKAEQLEEKKVETYKIQNFPISTDVSSILFSKETKGKSFSEYTDEQLIQRKEALTKLKTELTDFSEKQTEETIRGQARAAVDSVVQELKNSLQKGKESLQKYKQELLDIENNWTGSEEGKIKRVSQKNSQIKEQEYFNSRLKDEIKLVSGQGSIDVLSKRVASAQEEVNKTVFGQIDKLEEQKALANEKIHEFIIGSQDTNLRKLYQNAIKSEKKTRSYEKEAKTFDFKTAALTDRKFKNVISDWNKAQKEDNEAWDELTGYINDNKSLLKGKNTEEIKNNLIPLIQERNEIRKSIIDKNKSVFDKKNNADYKDYTSKKDKVASAQRKLDEEKEKSFYDRQVEAQMKNITAKTDISNYLDRMVEKEVEQSDGSIKKELVQIDGTIQTEINQIDRLIQVRQEDVDSVKNNYEAKKAINQKAQKEAEEREMAEFKASQKIQTKSINSSYKEKEEKRQSDLLVLKEEASELENKLKAVHDYIQEINVAQKELDEINSRINKNQNKANTLLLSESNAEINGEYINALKEFEDIKERIVKLDKVEKSNLDEIADGEKHISSLQSDIESKKEKLANRSSVIHFETKELEDKYYSDLSDEISENEQLLKVEQQKLAVKKEQISVNNKEIKSEKDALIVRQQSLNQEIPQLYSKTVDETSKKYWEEILYWANEYEDVNVRIKDSKKAGNEELEKQLNEEKELAKLGIRNSIDNYKLMGGELPENISKLYDEVNEGNISKKESDNIKQALENQKQLAEKKLADAKASQQNAENEKKSIKEKIELNKQNQSILESEQKTLEKDRKDKVDYEKKQRKHALEIQKIMDNSQYGDMTDYQKKQAAEADFYLQKLQEITPELKSQKNILDEQKTLMSNMTKGMDENKAEEFKKKNKQYLKIQKKVNTLQDKYNDQLAEATKYWNGLVDAREKGKNAGLLASTETGRLFLDTRTDKQKEKQTKIKQPKSLKGVDYSSIKSDMIELKGWNQESEKAYFDESKSFLATLDAEKDAVKDVISEETKLVQARKESQKQGKSLYSQLRIAGMTDTEAEIAMEIAKTNVQLKKRTDLSEEEKENLEQQLDLLYKRIKAEKLSLEINDEGYVKNKVSLSEYQKDPEKYATNKYIKEMLSSPAGSYSGSYNTAQITNLRPATESTLQNIQKILMTGIKVKLMGKNDKIDYKNKLNKKPDIDADNDPYGYLLKQQEKKKNKKSYVYDASKMYNYSKMSSNQQDVAKKFAKVKNKISEGYTKELGSELKTIIEDAKKVGLSYSKNKKNLYLSDKNVGKNTNEINKETKVIKENTKSTKENNKAKNDFFGLQSILNKKDAKQEDKQKALDELLSRGYQLGQHDKGGLQGKYFAGKTDKTSADITKKYAEENGLIIKSLEEIQNKAKETTGVVKTEIDKQTEIIDGDNSTKTSQQVVDLTSYSKEWIKSYLDGVEASTPEMEQAFKELALVPVEALKAILEINSPSKVMEQLGYWTVDGFAKGVKDNSEDIKKALIQAFTDAKVSQSDLANWLGLDETKSLIGKQGNNAIYKVIKDISSNNLLPDSYKTEQSSMLSLSKAKEFVKKNTDIKIDAEELKSLGEKVGRQWQISEDAIIEYIAKQKEAIEFQEKLNDSTDEFKTIQEIAYDNGLSGALDIIKNTSVKRNKNGKETSVLYNVKDAYGNSAVINDYGKVENKEIKKSKEIISKEATELKKLMSQVANTLSNSAVQEINSYMDALLPDGEKEKVDELRNAYLSLLNALETFENGTFDFNEESLDFINNQLNTIDNIKSSFTGEAINLGKIDISSPKELQSTLKGLAQELENASIHNVKFTKNNKEMTYQVIDADNMLNTYRITVSKTGEATKELVKSEKRLNTFQKLVSATGKKFGEIFNYMVASTSIYEIFNFFRRGITVVQEFDKAMTELYKVSNDTKEALDKFGQEAYNVAKQVGSTGSEIINSAADWTKLGYAIDEASELAKNSALYANVGDMDIDTATEHMVSTLKAFNVEAKDSISIVDKFNEIGNNYAISSAGIGEALERSASSLVAAGNDIDQAIALITAGNVVSQDPESVGNAIKVLSLRIRGSKSELEEMGEETDNLASSSSKLREELKALTGVDIMLDDNTYKDTYTILLEISKVWDQLSDVSQANVLEKLAGKTRASVVAGLLQQGETLENVYNDSVNAAGSATKENEKYLDSIQGHLDLLTNQWQSIWTSEITRDAVNTFIDIGTSLLKLVDGFGLVKTTFVGLTGLFAAKNFVNKKDGGGRDKMFSLVIKYATESFSREVCEFWCTLEW